MGRRLPATRALSRLGVNSLEESGSWRPHGRPSLERVLLKGQLSLLSLLPGLTGVPDGTPPATRGTPCPLWDAAGGADSGRSPLSTVHLGGRAGSTLRGRCTYLRAPGSPAHRWGQSPVLLPWPLGSPVQALMVLVVPGHLLWREEGWGCRWALAPGLPTFLPPGQHSLQRCQAVPFPAPCRQTLRTRAGAWAGHPLCLLVSSNSTWLQTIRDT